MEQLVSLPISRSPIGAHFDVVVVGSGFGGAVTACRLAQAGRSVAILERGRDYPNPRVDVSETGHGTRTTRYGHFQIDQGDGMNVIRGIGVGGGSLHYFGVRLRAWPAIFEDPRWPAAIDRATLDPYYDVAQEMLGHEELKPHPVLGMPARVDAFTKAAHACRRAVGEAHLVPLALNSSQEPRATPSGVDQASCVYCGECLVGCPASESFDGNVNARNLLTLNYIAVAKQHGAQVFAQCSAVHLQPRDGGGFALEVVVGSGADADVPQGEHGVVTADEVVVAAGTLGSTELLLRSVDALPGLSERLGDCFSGNGDFLVPKTTGTPMDLQPTSGPLICLGADFSTDEHSVFIEDLGAIPFVEAVLGMEKLTNTTVKRHQIGYLGMGTDAANGTMVLKDGSIYVEWDGEDSLPLYNHIEASLREMSQQLGGNYEPPRSYDPTTGNDLLTAHPLGGCPMGDDATQGVVDDRGRVFGVPGLYVADGAIIPTALAVNPSFTITALAERVAFFMLHGRELTADDAARPPSH